MTPTVVQQVLCWMRIADHDLRTLTLFGLFTTAYYWKFRKTDRVRITQDMALMAMSGQVPFYLQLFIRKELYPIFVRRTEVVQPKLIV